jgi:hypothetical protein
MCPTKGRQTKWLNTLDKGGVAPAGNCPIVEGLFPLIQRQDNLLMSDMTEPSPP